MKKRVAVTAWAALLTILLLLVACGPAVSSEQAEQMTAEAGSAESISETSEVAGPEAPEDELPAGPGIPEVEGELTETESGLQVIEIVPGDGRQAEEGDIVTMNILVMMEDGTVLADSATNGAPITANATEADLFAGWLEGLLLMKEGGKSRLIIPAALAFGEEGIEGFIPAGETITMDIDLISAAAPPTPTAVDEDDLVTTESGLQYYDLVEGEGDMPVSGQEVVIHYAVWLQDGETYIASSEAVGEPVTFALDGDMGIFPGWNEGVSTMRPGGKRLLVIPPELALGETGSGPVPPNATLLMEVELVEVMPLVLPTEVSEADFTETESGLRYYDIIEGDGATAEAGNEVTVDYTGWLTNNVKFDSSLESGFPFTFILGDGNVIEGWEEGVQGMKVGGVRQLVIPAELAYGDMGAGMIPPGATLIFEIALHDVVEVETE